MKENGMNIGGTNEFDSIGPATALQATL